MNSADFHDKEAAGESDVFLDFQEKISRVAKVDRPVLLIGERGTGKEMAAYRLHYLSKRWASPFVTLNCAALPAELIESELFGHTSGAFTGARQLRKGRFEEADGGTLFLDELGLIPMNVQEKILRVVEYGCFERVGSSETTDVDVRIIGATNSDLVQLCDSGKFKRDLLDRLSFEVLFLPPLRVRGDDILLLANLFASRMASELGIEKPSFSVSAVHSLKSYLWPGNIRELKNTVERAVYICRNGIIEELELNPFKYPWKTAETAAASQHEDDAVPLQKFKDFMKKTEKKFLQRALDTGGGNQKKAAALLGISYDSFRGLYRKHFGAR
ncbi:MAG: sigma 54-interacting transcriptional regulator [Treponema sp.]|nr:sigma 54-interacting transcriptional regulator [Treponema sp.]